ncbi:MAG: hypothetical protein U9Q83_07395 [Bacteroidota bacterium]|nr:hypothetical protein [Bacteroidota bacterium]
MTLGFTAKIIYKKQNRNSKFQNNEKIITIIIAIAIFQIPTIFAQTFVENRYFHPNNSTVKNTGMYENKLLFVHYGNLYLIDGENSPIYLTSVPGDIEDSFMWSGQSGIITEFMIDNENNFIN